MIKKLDKTLIVVMALATGLFLFSVAKYPELVNQQKTNERLTKELKESKQTLVKVTEEQRPVYNEAVEKLTTLFSTMRTYSSQQTYDQIRETVKPLLSEKAFNETNALKLDKDKLVTQLEEVQEYQKLTFMPTSFDTDVVSGTVIVDYTTQMQDRKPVATNTLYDITYSQKEKKITHLKLQGKLETNIDSSLL